MLPGDLFLVHVINTVMSIFTVDSMGVETSHGVLSLLDFVGASGITNADDLFPLSPGDQK
jgi:hypothetical protein